MRINTNGSLCFNLLLFHFCVSFIILLLHSHGLLRTMQQVSSLQLGIVISVASMNHRMLFGREDLSMWYDKDQSNSLSGLPSQTCVD